MTAARSAPLAVIGASGLLGRELLRVLQAADLGPVIGTAQRRVGAQCRPLDLTDQAAVEHFMRSVRPAVTLIVAGEKRADICERDPARAQALNVSGPAWIARCAAQLGARALYISSDYVFDGTAPPYRSTSPTCPLNAYGRSKRDGEQAVLAAGAGMAVLRLPLLFGPTDDLTESAVTNLLPQAAAGGTMPVDDWALRYPTLTSDVAEVCRQLLAAWLAGGDLDGIHHWSGSVPCSKYALSLRLARLTGLPAERFVATWPGPAEVPRPRDCQLASDTLTRFGIHAETPLEQALAQVLQPHLRHLAQMQAR